jgi:hypothetical protein
VSNLVGWSTKCWKTATGTAVARFGYDDPSCLFVFDCSQLKGDDQRWTIFMVGDENTGASGSLTDHLKA